MIINFKKTILLQVNKFYVGLYLRKILNAAKHNKQIFLETKTPIKCKGTPQHYYHFLFDLVLPLHILITRTKPDVKFIVEEPGLFTDLLKKIFPKRVITQSNIETPNNKLRYALIGMNPNGVGLKSEVFENLKTYLCETLDIRLENSKTKYILLIERLPPDPFYKSSKSKNKSAGTARRSIPNQSELLTTLKSMINPEYSFHNIQLEKMTFEEQILFFHQAHLVIGQHGAGLGNCVWMQKGNNVVEFTNNEKLTHFRIIAIIKNLRHFVYKTSGTHAPIDIKHFSSWLKSQKNLEQYFINDHEN